MKQKRHSPEEIIKKLREAEALIAAGKGIDGTARGIGVRAATYQRWKSRYEGMKQDALKRLRELEKENVRLKRAVACLALEVEHTMGAREMLTILEKLVAGAERRNLSAVTTVRNSSPGRSGNESNPKGSRRPTSSPGPPGRTPYTESFNARLRDDFLNVELFSSKLEAKVRSAEHREKYNNQRPHFSLGGECPGGVCGMLSCYGSASGLRCARQRNQPQTPTIPLITSGPNFGGILQNLFKDAVHNPMSETVGHA